MRCVALKGLGPQQVNIHLIGGTFRTAASRADDVFFNSFEGKFALFVCPPTGSQKQLVDARFGFGPAPPPVADPRCGHLTQQWIAALWWRHRRHGLVHLPINFVLVS